MQIKSSCLITGLNIIWAGIIFLLCAMPGEDIPTPRLNIPHLDKIVHAGMFFIMSFLICLHFDKKQLRHKTVYAIAILFAFVYGGLIEILQHFFFHRSADVLDLLADIAGGITGCWFYSFLKRKYSQ